MTTLRHFSLGEACPNSPHAVASSLPTMADVCGYEEKDPRVMTALSTGYPRFVEHPFVAKLIEFFAERESLSGRGAVLIPGRRASYDLLEAVGGDVQMIDVGEGLHLVYFDPIDEQLASAVRKYVQHCGCGISSRQAEDFLLLHGCLGTRFEESRFPGNAQIEVETEIANLIGCRPQDVLLCSSGMNAFYAGFRAVQEFQSSRGRQQWLQLGWLYLDSGCILKNYLGEGETLEFCYDVTDTEALIAAIENAGTDLAAVVVECPTNPLAQVCELAKVATAVRACGAVMIVDPTIASIYNVDVLAYSDLLVTSLTKYAAWAGDVMIGTLALNPESPFYSDLVLRTSRYHSPPYARDLARLADLMLEAPAIVMQMNRNARELASFLKTHPAVRRVHYAPDASTFQKVSHAAGRGGAIVTIEIEGSMKLFYDAVQVMKGPSFGTKFTLLSPFMYLAHYDLVTNPEGRRFLEGLGLCPELIRISVGVEPIKRIKSVFQSALDQVVES